MDILLDQPVFVREGEGLDLSALERYLRDDLAIALTAPLQLLQFPGGASNLTYLLVSGDREWVLRRPPQGAKAKAAHDMVREARLMEALHPHFPLVPRVYAICSDERVLGAEFYLMERRRGVILRRDLPAGFRLSEQDLRRLCHDVLDCLVRLHAVDVEQANLSSFGRGEGYVRRQIEGWTEWYARARTEGAPTFERVTAWLRERMPARETRICVIHNDFRFDNVVLDPTDNLRPVGVLDWELSTLGDPLMDLGCMLAYWIQADDPPGLLAGRRQPTHLPGMLTRAEVVRYYAEQSGHEVRDVPFYETYGLFRLAGIAQQIYARFRRGLTHNPEFEGFGKMVPLLEQRCLDIIARAG